MELTKIEIVVDATRTPETIRGIRNVIILTKILGTIEPELVGGFARSLPEAIALTKEHESKRLGLWRMHTLRLDDKPLDQEAYGGRLRAEQHKCLR